MKNFFTFLFVWAVLLMVGCSDSYDDSTLVDRMDSLENRVTKLEELCKQMNTNISSLQSIITAIQSNDYITNVTPVVKDGETIGYTISFTKSQPITIYHGQDGKDGSDGKDGIDGADGYTPQIGVKQDTDGIYYWTVDGEWLLDSNGNKVKAVGTDGKDGIDGADGSDGTDGTNGKDGTNGEDGADGKDGKDGVDGITPQLKIENDYWYVSYDNGTTWVQLGKATGEKGEQGEQGPQGDKGDKGDVGLIGDSMFTDIDYSNEEYVIFTLSNGTTIQVPTWYAFEQLQTLCNQMNTNISALQTIVTALQNNDYVQSITPLMENGKEIGYTITFSKSGTVTIYHGKDGANGNDGQNGTNGTNGADGHTPQIGVKQDADGIYYWTVDGEWLLDSNGNKVKAVGTDGKDGADGSNGADGTNGNDGTNGKDGITPQLKIENGKWYVSYDEGITWIELGQATGDQGPQGPQGPQGDPGVGGDSMFANIDYSNEEYVIFTLSNGTTIQVPTWYAFEQLQKLCNQMNTNISSLQVIVAALQNNDYVQSIVPLMDNGKEVGYTITFTKSGTVNIYHGKDGKDGANGTDGKDGQDGTNGADGVNGTDGKDGHTPIIGVKQHTDGIYYWTIDGEWLLDDNGNKVKAVGTDGKDGTNGTDGKDGQDGTNGSNGNDGATGPQGPQGPQGEQGVTPQLKIENGYWYVSYDNGSSWKQLGKATGEDGKDGQDGTNGTDGKDGADGKDGVDGKDGDSFFQSVDASNSDYVILTLADGTEIKLPTWYAFEQLQKLCNQMNTNISALQTIVTALQNNDYVQSITPLMENGKEIGYTITFSKSGTVTIYHGKDGANGSDGQDGTNGADGHTPQIGVKQDTDGIYYWTVDGEWLLDSNGNKVKAVGTDGKDGADGSDGADGNNGNDGTNGKDGITPQLKIENGYWYVSYDNGATWAQLGKATGEDGADGTNGTNGQDGDSFFQSVTQDENNVYLTLADGTKITIPLASSYLFNRLQSVSYIPQYSDGKATVIDGVVEMDFQISPKDAVADIAADWQSILSLKAVYTITRAVSFVNMPILSCEADEANGVITITASAKNFSEEFFAGTQEASAALSISDGNNSIVSDYVLTTPYHPYNEFWYTTKDCTTMEPADYIDFGAKIISNTYQNGKGVIKFDGTITQIYCSSGGNNVFDKNKYNLTSIKIPDSVTLISSGAFYGHGNLAKIDIGGGMQTLGNSGSSVFNVGSVTEISVIVYCRAQTPPAVSYPNGPMFTNLSVIYVPRGKVEAYQSAPGWEQYATKIKEGDFE